MQKGNKKAESTNKESPRNRLRTLRLAANLKQSELAGFLKCSPSMIVLIEAQQRNIGWTMAILISKLFHVSLDYLFCNTDNPAIPEPIISRRMSINEDKDIEKINEYWKHKEVLEKIPRGTL